jgi:hypothetical protein
MTRVVDSCGFSLCVAERRQFPFPLFTFYFPVDLVAATLLGAGEGDWRGGKGVAWWVGPRGHNVMEMIRQ